MSKLRNIPSIDEASLELLEAVGFTDFKSLAKADLSSLVDELERANVVLKLSSRAPGCVRVAEWINFAQQEVSGVVEKWVETKKPEHHEISPQMLESLATAPFAIPLPAKFLIDQGLAVGSIPPGILLSQYAGVDVRVEKRVPSVQTRAAVPTGNIKLAEASGHRTGEIDHSKIKSTEILAGAAPRREAPKDENERLTLLRAPLEKTNRGRDPHSSFYIRGVLHSHPISLATGAVVTLFLITVLPLAIVSSALLLLSQELPLHFGWVPKWVLVFPLSLPLLGLAYLIWGLSGSCRICGQKLFLPRMCLKNSKAHHVKWLGHIVPVSFHMLVFKWFRCTYCGTPVRLKK
jgi:Domain of unknown function (DUF4332)